MTARVLIWGPTASGKAFTNTEAWQLKLLGKYRYSLVVGSKKYGGTVDKFEKLSSSPGVIWSSICIQFEGFNEIVLDGIPNDDALAMVNRVQVEIDAYFAQAVKKLIPQLDTEVPAIVDWYLSVRAGTEAELKGSGWLGEDYFERMQKDKPESELSRLIDFPDVQMKLMSFDKFSQNAVAVWNGSMPSWAKDINEEHVQSELVVSKNVFTIS